MEPWKLRHVTVAVRFYGPNRWQIGFDVHVDKIRSDCWQRRRAVDQAKSNMEASTLTSTTLVAKLAVVGESTTIDWVANPPTALYTAIEALRQCRATPMLTAKLMKTLYALSYPIRNGSEEVVLYYIRARGKCFPRGNIANLQLQNRVWTQRLRFRTVLTAVLPAGHKEPCHHHDAGGGDDDDDDDDGGAYDDFDMSSRISQQHATSLLLFIKFQRWFVGVFVFVFTINVMVALDYVAMLCIHAHRVYDLRD
jgi:hypothetical protein